MYINKRNDILILRVLSMAFIVLCHIVKYYDFIPGASYLGVVFDVGVYVFFMISGFLYGNKTISCFSKWYLKRIRKICVPAVALSVICIVIHLSVYKIRFSVVTVLTYIFSLQGLSMLGAGIPNFEEIVSLGPLWFVTVIMLCYPLVPALQQLKRCSAKLCIRFAFTFLFAAVIRLLAGFNLMYFVTFIFGYLLSNKDLLKVFVKPKYLLPITAFSLIVQALRVVFMMRYDNTAFYYMYVTVSHFFLAFMIMLIVSVFCKKYDGLCCKAADSKPMLFLDRNSMYIYLVHGVFCMGQINLYEKTDNLLLSTILFLASTAIGVLALRFIDVCIPAFFKRVFQKSS